MTEDEPEKSAWNKAVEQFKSEYIIHEDDEKIDIHEEGANLAELLFKIRVIETKHDGEELPELNWAIETITLSRLRTDILEAIDDYSEYDEPEIGIAISASDDVMLFFTLANEVIRGLSGEILNEEIVDESIRDNSSLSSMTDLRQETQEDLLYYSGVIDSGLKGELARVRKTRNKLVHDLRQRHFLEGMNNLESRIERTVDAINELHERSQGRTAFGTISSESDTA